MAVAPLTKRNIQRKVDRKRNPVSSMTQLAREFGYDTSKWSWNRNATSHSTTAPIGFRRKVKNLVGITTYKKIRDDRFLNKAYR